MRRSLRISLAALLLVSSLLTPGCGDADAPAEVETFDPTIRLPTAERFGAIPPPHERVTISISRLGDVRVNGEATTLHELQTAIGAAVGVRLPPRTLRKVVRARTDGESIEEEIEGGEEAPEVIEEEIVTEEPVIKEEEIDDAPFEEAEGLSDPEGDGQPSDSRAADLQRNNPKNEVVELPPRDPDVREKAPVDAQLARPVDVLLVIDERVPWRLVAEVAMACADPRLKLYRIFTLVTGDEAPGAIAMFLPIDGGLCGGRIVVGTDVHVSLRSRKAGLDGVSLREQLPRYRERKGDALFVSLRAAELAPWGQVVALMDEALAAGAYAFTYEGFPGLTGERDAATWIELAQGRGPYNVTVRGARADKAAPATAVKPGRRATYFGFGNAVTMADPEVVEEDLEDEPLEEPVEKK